MINKAVCFSSTVLMLIFVSAYANAREIKVSGIFEQGGFIIGQVDKTINNVKVNGEDKHISNEGKFVIGIGRDYDGEIKITTKDEKKIIPIAKREWGIQRINGLKKDKVTPSKESIKRIEKEFSYIRNARKEILYNNYFANGFINPIKDGQVSGEFGNQRILNGEAKNPHSGTDIAAPAGTDIMASGDGIVSLSQTDLFYTGNVVMINHGLGLQTIYAHMDKVDVKVGQKVKKGQKIGTVGATGRATGPHLHFGSSVDNVKFDPMNLMQGNLFGVK